VSKSISNLDNVHEFVPSIIAGALRYSSHTAVRQKISTIEEFAITDSLCVGKVERYIPVPVELRMMPFDDHPGDLQMTVLVMKGANDKPSPRTFNAPRY
jgi:hypothetical protein